MSDEYAGTPTYHATVTVVDDGDPPTAASVAAGIEDCCDREAYLKGKADAFDSANTRLGALVPGYPGGAFVVTLGPSNLHGSFDAVYGGVGNTHIGGAGRISSLPLSPDVPAGTKIGILSMTVTGSNWATMPTVAAKITLREYDPATDALVDLYTFTDAAAAVSTMNSRRVIGGIIPSGSRPTIKSGRYYHALVVEPSGGSGTSGSNQLITYLPVAITLVEI